MIFNRKTITKLFVKNYANKFKLKSFYHKGINESFEEKKTIKIKIVRRAKDLRLPEHRLRLPRSGIR